MWQVSHDGGSDPVWSRDGKKLFCRNGARRMVTVDVVADSTFSAGTHHHVSGAGILYGTPADHSYAVTSHGRFLMLESKAAAAFVAP